MKTQILVALLLFSPAVFSQTYTPETLEKIKKVENNITGNVIVPQDAIAKISPLYPKTIPITAGDVFSHVAAFSPGLMAPRDARGKPRIFISHGTSDPVMPIDETSRRFVPALKKLGYDVTFREYDGRHNVPDPIVREAFAWFAK